MNKNKDDITDRDKECFKDVWAIMERMINTLGIDSTTKEVTVSSDKIIKIMADMLCLGPTYYTKYKYCGHNSRNLNKYCGCVMAASQLTMDRLKEEKK